ncbi:MAG: SoxR reducing system RseC family protein [Candidatus Thiodiazotropha endolucinida]|nr:SoxR reducing system RseC family protein [Candidatus Thiodiazotropha endolucinida]
MLEEFGTVVEVWDEGLLVETQSRSACSHCSSGNCTTAVVSKLFGIKHNRFELDNNLGVQPGEKVVIGIPDELLVRASVRAYLLPLLVTVLATAIGSVVGLSEGLQSLLALGGLAMGLIWVRWLTQGVTSRQQFKPQLLRIVERDHVRVEMPNLTRS